MSAPTTRSSDESDEGRTRVAVEPPAPVSPADTRIASPSPQRSDEAWTRIAALKQRVPVSAGKKPKAFDYDEDTPLQLIPDVKPPRR